MDELDQIISRAYDLHVHIGPEVIPRKYTVDDLARVETGKISGCVLKNHFYPTAPMIVGSRQSSLDTYGSVVLNNALGGMNPEAIYASSLLTTKPVVVWLPTINAEQFLKTNKYEIAPEWVRDKTKTLKSADETTPVRVTQNGRLLPATQAVIEMIAQVSAVLATGHIATDESVLVARQARKLGIQVIITHPIYQHIAMPVTVQQELADLGCYMEQPYSMFSMDDIPVRRISEQILSVGTDAVILSSDVGQEFSPSPSQALKEFSLLLMEEGISLKGIEQMLVDNPKKILAIT